MQTQLLDNTNGRTRRLNSIRPDPGPVGYVMTRDHRAWDNWSLLHAQQLALTYQSPLVVIVPFAADYPNLPDRQRWFLSESLSKLETELRELNLPLILLNGNPVVEIMTLVNEYKLTHLVLDFSPLKESRRWKDSLVERSKIPIDEVDAHNIIPVWETSDKLEYAAYTIRPKISRQLNRFLVEIPPPARHPFDFDKPVLRPDISTVSVKSFNLHEPLIAERWTPGRQAGLEAEERFLAHRISRYGQDRNNPNGQAQSELSPYLHFGLISAQQLALDAHRFETEFASLESFLDELIVRRELSDNFCYYNPDYDSFNGFPNWARTTLNDHRPDRRPYHYSLEQFELAETHDELWNAAQTEMTATGKMHGYLRMYWAKKILEWTDSPETALDIANLLNNRYELDGNDPNGYAGTAWSIGGVHDRAWPEREIFGKIRYMNYNGCKRKFDIPAYVASVATYQKITNV